MNWINKSDLEKVKLLNFVSSDLPVNHELCLSGTINGSWSHYCTILCDSGMRHLSKFYDVYLSMD